jgi:hypothetical protein
MSGKSDRASGARAKSRRKAEPVDLPTVRRMLPLVQRIVSDIVLDHKELNRFAFEQEGLDRNKRELSWPERERRYTVQGELSRLQTRLDDEQRELDSLGAVLFGSNDGRIGFPTLVNGRPAYFSWQLGEDGINYWHFDGEAARRPIPTNWNETNQIKLLNQR